MADASSSSSSVTIPENLKLLISNLSSLVTVKLDPTNFIVWRKQVQNILQVTYLFGYLDGTMACPSPITKDSNGKDVVNTEFMKWKIIDSHLLSCLTATLTTPVFSLVLDLSTSREVWLALEKCFTTLSRSHIHQLKDRLSNVSKGTKTMEECLKQIKEIADQLAIASCPIHDEDLVFHILHGLPNAYDAFKTSIRTRSESISVDELTALLCSESIHIDSNSKALSSTGDLTVAFATNVSGSMHSASPYSGSRGIHSGFRGRYPFRGGYRGGRSNFRGSGRSFGRNIRFPNFNGQTGASTSSGSSSTSGSDLVVCQICNRPNHTAWTCWYRMDSTFQPPSATSQPSTRAFVASSSTTPTTDWYLDSAATHHITNNLSNMHLYQPYHSNDQVMVGNGANLPIQNSVKGILPTPFHSCCLNQVLHVPTLTTNLVSVQKFTKDNNCTITFDDSSFLVQDKVTKRTLSKGYNHNGLYQFSSSASSDSQPQAHLSTAVSAATWHSRLGHPSPLKFQHLAKHLQLSLNKCTSLQCTHCAVS